MAAAIPIGAESQVRHNPELEVLCFIYLNWIYVFRGKIKSPNENWESCRL
jgi:hypothetical protein